MRYDRLVGKDGSPYFTLKASNGQVIGQSKMYPDLKERGIDIDACKVSGSGATASDLTG